MRRLLVNDCLAAFPGHRTFWNDLQDWFGMDFQGGEFSTLANLIDSLLFEPEPDYPEETPPSLIVRNASYFPPLESSERVPTISLLQDIFTEGPQREMQTQVVLSSRITVCNSLFTKFKAVEDSPLDPGRFTVIPLPVDFSLFEPQNPMGCQQALSLPDGCVCWIGACQGAAGQVKGWDIFIQVARLNPDLHFVAVLKDAFPDSIPPNLRCYVRLTHEELVKVIGTCRVGLCTSRMESQHLAGIEMGACGLPLVVPNVGTYWNRDIGWPGTTVLTDAPSAYVTAIRGIFGAEKVLGRTPELVREYWRKEFDREVVRKQWEALINGVEGGSDAAV